MVNWTVTKQEKRIRVKKVSVTAFILVGDMPARKQHSLAYLLLPPLCVRVSVW